MITREEAKELYGPVFWTDWSKNVQKETIDFCNDALDKTIYYLAKQGITKLWIPFLKCAVVSNTFPNEWRYDYCSIGLNCKIQGLSCKETIPTYIHLPTLKKYVEQHGFTVEESQAFIGDKGTTYTIYWN